MKFAILHVDQAVELLLKERVRAGGISIYKGSKETISIWKAYEILENDLKRPVPEKPDLELLHEERNNIQHKFANPTPEDAGFYIEKAFNFIDRFLRDELKTDVRDHVSMALLEPLLPAQTKP